MKKLTIAVDIDDVIAASAPAFIAYSNEKFGTHLTVDDYHERWGDVWKVEQEELIKRAHEYHESGDHAKYGVIDGAKDSLKELRRNFRLIVLTTRRNSINQLTRDWINKFYPDIFDDFVFTGFYDDPTVGGAHMTKAELARGVGAQYLIDDQLKHILASAEIGIKGLLFGDYFWNKADHLPTNVERVRNWTEVLEYFGREINPL
ncbi:hypothetical protein KW800_02725 [Candidatus Parcubacteria bacterium]|nr:hypothetical protein [Candidatus Parcubacteria bacterium]